MLGRRSGPSLGGTSTLSVIGLVAPSGGMPPPRHCSAGAYLGHHVGSRAIWSARSMLMSSAWLSRSASCSAKKTSPATCWAAARATHTRRINRRL